MGADSVGAVRTGTSGLGPFLSATIGTGVVVVCVAVLGVGGGDVEVSCVIKVPSVIARASTLAVSAAI